MRRPRRRNGRAAQKRAKRLAAQNAKTWENVKEKKHQQQTGTFGWDPRPRKRQDLPIHQAVCNTLAWQSRLWHHAGKRAVHVQTWACNQHPRHKVPNQERQFPAQGCALTRTHAIGQLPQQEEDRPRCKGLMLKKGKERIADRECLKNKALYNEPQVFQHLRQYTDAMCVVGAYRVLVLHACSDCSTCL